MYKRLALFFFVVYLASCSHKVATTDSGNAKSTEQSIPSTDYEKDGYVTAYVMDMRALDGCDHLLVLESGKKLQPLKLADEYKEDNLKVWIKYSVAKGMVGICMSGTMVNLTAIEKRQ